MFINLFQTLIYVDDVFLPDVPTLSCSVAQEIDFICRRE